MLEKLSEQLPALQYAHLLWGFGLFVALALWAYWPSRKQKMNHYAELILKDDSDAAAQPMTISAARGHHVAEH